MVDLRWVNFISSFAYYYAGVLTIENTQHTVGVDARSPERILVLLITRPQSNEV